jgi:3'(2'), 5'-bisphosphate nucleotidase
VHYDIEGLVMESEQPPPLLAEVLDIARAAGRAALSIYDRGFSVELKADSSPLTEADRAAHELICDGLASLEPKLPLLSEEAPEESARDRRQWQRYWLVDPLDGTKEFIKRNGEFTINIALVEEGRATLGVVVAPALGVEYSGALGFGAWKQATDGIPRRIHVCVQARTPLRVVGSRSHAGAELSAYLGRLGPHVLKSIGSSLKICLVAEGEADVYPRLGPTREWDTAAAQAILESAGGCMMDTSGRPLRYNSKDDLLNPHFLAFGDPKRDWLGAFQSE